MNSQSVQLVTLPSSHLEMKMDYLSAMRAGFNDEFADIVRTSHNKLAGFLRAGRRPFKATTLLKKTPKAKKAEMVKLSAEPQKLLKMPKGSGKYLAVAGLGALGYDQARKAKRDWETGRQMRIQQGY